MPDTIVTDWNALEKERDSYLRKHLRFATDMKIVLASIKRREQVADAPAKTK